MKLIIPGEAGGRVPDGCWPESGQRSGSQCTCVPGIDMRGGMMTYDDIFCPGPAPVYPDLLHLLRRHQHRPHDQRRDHERPEDVSYVRDELVQQLEIHAIIYLRAVKFNKSLTLTSL